MASEENEYERLLEAVTVAQQRHDEAKREENRARRIAIEAENALRDAEKAFADYMVAQHPRLVDELAKRRRG